MAHQTKKATHMHADREKGAQRVRDRKRERELQESRESANRDENKNDSIVDLLFEAKVL